MAEKYEAVVGIDFEGLKLPARVEPGDPIPDKISTAEIQQLLADGHIREVRAGENEAQK